MNEAGIVIESAKPIQAQVAETNLPAAEAKVNYQYASLPPETARELKNHGYSHTLAAELHKTTGEKPYESLAKVSTLERQGVKTSHTQWEAEMRQWIKTSQNKFLARLVGFEPGKNPTDKEIEIGLKTISGFFKTNGDPDITSFANQVAEMVKQGKYDLRILQDESTDFFTFCQVFGQDTGIAAAQLIGREVSKGSEIHQEIKPLTKAEESLLNNVSAALGNVNAEAKIKKPESLIERHDIKETIEKMAKSSSVGGVKDIGGRRRQEDSFAVFNKDGKQVAVVADGVGGEESGDKSSQYVVSQIDALGFSKKSFEEWFQKTRDKHHDKGSSAVATVALENGLLHLANVGDANVYLTDTAGANLELISRQDTGARENVITQHIKDYHTIHYREQTVSKGQIALVCSDGLYRTLGQKRVGEIINKNKDRQAEDIAGILVNIAVAEGSKDNVTAVVLKC